MNNCLCIKKGECIVKKLSFVVIAFVLLMMWMGARIYNSYLFDIGAGGHLKRAADSNTVELATKEIDVAVKYIEDKGLTNGYTSIIFKTPDEDIGFWYQNLKSSLAELKAVPANANQLEKSNVLMKLRETLVDQGDKGVSITAPDGISVYPNNTAFALWGWLSLIGFLLSIVWVTADDWL